MRALESTQRDVNWSSVVATWRAVASNARFYFDFVTAGQPPNAQPGQRQEISLTRRDDRLGLARSFGKHRSGSFTFIVGPSGSGKSTLLYLMGALEEPTAGSIAFNGRNLASFSRKERDAYRQRDVGFVFQNFNLLQNMHAVDNVLVPFLPGGVSTELRDRAVELLKMVGLGETAVASPQPALRRRAATGRHRQGTVETTQANPRR